MPGCMQPTLTHPPHRRDRKDNDSIGFLSPRQLGVKIWCGVVPPGNLTRKPDAMCGLDAAMKGDAASRVPGYAALVTRTCNTAAGY